MLGGDHRVHGMRLAVTGRRISAFCATALQGSTTLSGTRLRPRLTQVTRYLLALRIFVKMAHLELASIPF